MKEFSKVKIAIFYDWLNQWGGAERLLLDILKLYPEAHLFTSVHEPHLTPWLSTAIPIHTTFLNKYPFFRKNTVFSALLQPFALEQLNFDAFDIVISLTSQQGKALLTSPQTMHLCYCLTPHRYLYEKHYSPLLAPLINRYKKIDLYYAQRPDYYIAISRTVQKRIHQQYHRPSLLVYPGTDLKLFKPDSNLYTRQKYYLIISRLVAHKKIDLAIRACLQTGNSLKIIGSGRDLSRLQRISKNSSLIQFLGNQTQENIIQYYNECRALICPQLEDFGLTAIEAQACGTPVIAYGQGAFSETVIDSQTGLLFAEQSVSSLIQSLKIFPKNNFSAALCRQNAQRFSQEYFMVDFDKIVKDLWQQHQKTTTIW